MNDVPLCFVENVLLAVDYYYLHGAKQLTEPWASVADLNIEKRVVLRLNIDIRDDTARASCREISRTSLIPWMYLIPFSSCDLKFVTNVQVSTRTTDFEEKVNPHWEIVPMAFVETMITKRAYKKVEHIHSDTNVYLNEACLRRISETTDTSGIGRWLVKSMPPSSHVDLHGIRGYQQEIEEFLERMAPFHHVHATNCTDLTPHHVDLLVDGFRIGAKRNHFELVHSRMTEDQLMRLIEHVCMHDMSCHIEIRLDTKPKTAEQFLQLSAFSEMFADIKSREGWSFVARKEKNSEMELLVKVESPRLLFIWQDVYDEDEEDEEDEEE